MSNNTKQQAETAFAKGLYKNRASINKKAQAAILAGSRQITIRLSNTEIALARQQAETKGLKYQTYIKMLLHEALAAREPLSTQTTTRGADLRR